MPLFCELIKKEKTLYTKIELQKALVKYGEKSILHLIPLLGTIGNNQHKEIKIITSHNGIPKLQIDKLFLNKYSKSVFFE